MKTPFLAIAISTGLLASCDVKVDKNDNPPSGTTVVAPGETKVEKNTTVINPPKEEKKVENNTTIIKP